MDTLGAGINPSLAWWSPLPPPPRTGRPIVEGPKKRPNDEHKSGAGAGGCGSVGDCGRGGDASNFACGGPARWRRRGERGCGRPWGKALWIDHRRRRGSGIGADLARTPPPAAARRREAARQAVLRRPQGGPEPSNGDPPPLRESVCGTPAEHAAPFVSPDTRLALRAANLVQERLWGVVQPDSTRSDPPWSAETLAAIRVPAGGALACPLSAHRHARPGTHTFPRLQCTRRLCYPTPPPFHSVPTPRRRGERLATPHPPLAAVALPPRCVVPPLAAVLADSAPTAAAVPNFHCPRLITTHPWPPPFLTEASRPRPSKRGRAACA